MNTLTQIEFVYVVGFLISIIITLMLGSLNFLILFKPLKVNISLWNLFRYYSLTWALSFFAPGRIGELSFIYFLKKKIALGTSSSLYIVDKIISLFFMSFLAILGFLTFFNKIEATKWIIITLIIFFILIFVVVSQKSRDIIKKYFLRKYSIKFKGFSKTMFIYIKKHKELLIYDIILTLIKISITSFGFYLLFIGLDTRVKFIDVLLIHNIVTIISLIPLSLNGLGIREYSAVVLFSKIGLDPITVASVYFIILIIRYIVAVLVTFIIKKEDLMI